MDKNLLRIVDLDAKSIGGTVDWKKLSKYTRKLSFGNIDTINWKRVEHLHIISSSESTFEDSELDFQPMLTKREGYIEDTVQKPMPVSEAEEKVNGKKNIFFGHTKRKPYSEYAKLIENYWLPTPVYRLENDRGLYISDEMTWMLLWRPPVKLIKTVVSQMGERLELLNIRFTDLTDMMLPPLPGLKILNLSENTRLTQISGMGHMPRLETLNLSDTEVGPTIDISDSTNLKELDLSGAKQLKLVRGIRQCVELRTADFSDTSVGPVLDVSNLKCLKVLRVPFGQKLSLLKGLNNLQELENLDLSCGRCFPLLKSLFRSVTQEDDFIRESETETFDYFAEILNLKDSLRYKVLSQDAPSETDPCTSPPFTYRKDSNKDPTQCVRLPNQIQSLKSLKRLDISGLTLEELPDWLPDLGMNFTLTSNSGIIMNDTKVPGVDMSIFSQPQEVILQWFEERKKANAGAPLNEVKVVFLGDGEVGKSHTIARLLNDGGAPVNFNGDSTPGIVITDKSYDIGDRNVRVHFWDFGGQEILHSMHRIFLTERTLYVVLLNARDNTQNERARYWLHNIRSFAGNAPVLLVLNKTDQNEHATVNVSDLREICPNLPEAVYLSALRDSPEEFNRKLTVAMLDAIGKIDTINTFFPNSWKQVKNALETMETPYIKGDAYKKLCDDNQVDGRIQRDVLDLFKTLGVSFYYPGAKLEDYVVLRPDWITNAIYIILFNKRDEVKNGLISHDTIYRLLNPREGDTVKRVLANATYNNAEVTYVLDVVRRFRLSYLVEDGVEFIPMLCGSNSLPVAAEYAADLDTLEFRMIYDYLPNNVIHRLMVELRQHLDRDNVWLTGALFREKSKGFSAVVKTEGNLLRIFVRAEKPRYAADMYLDTIRDALERINADMGLKVAENQVVYKADGIVECFDYDDLLLSQELGDTMVTSRVRRKKVPIADILSQTDHRVDEARAALIENVLSACRSLQTNQMYWQAKEDERNTYIRDILKARKYIVADQTRSGISAGGKQAGELDLDIRMEGDIPWTIFEALNLSGKGAAQIAYWDGHLEKLLDHYNANGLPFLLHVSYVECAKDKFGTICAAYSDHLRFHSPAQYPLQFTGAVRTTPDGYGENHFIQAYQCVYDCDGFPTTVYHIFVRMGA